MNSSRNLQLLPATAAVATALTAWGVYTYLTYDPRWWWKKRQNSLTFNEVSQQPQWEQELIHGKVEPGWEPVYEEFLQNFRARGDLGAAVCIYYQGKKVVDLWGGYQDPKNPIPWKEDTMVPIFSTSKGISAFAIWMLESWDKIQLDEKVCSYWPEFAQNGKENVTVAQLIDHSVGLAGITPPITLKMLQDPDSKRILKDHLAKAKMEWANASDYKGYMAVILGFYESILVQICDFSQRSIGQFLLEEAFQPLGIENEIYIRLPKSVPDNRIAKLDAMVGLENLWPTGSFPEDFWSKLLLRPNSYTGRAFRNPRLSSSPGCMDYDRREVQELEMPASGGVATARAIAKMYNAAERVIQNKDNDNPLKLSPKALDRCLQPATPGRKNGWIDEVLGIECCMGAGVLLAAPNGCSSGRFFSTPSGFGTPGAGGSFGYCDPKAEVSYAYVMNRCGQCVDDPREFALRSKMYEVVQKFRKTNGEPLLNLEELNVPHYLTKVYMDAHPELAPL